MVNIKDKLKIKILENNNEVLPILIRDIGKNLTSGEDIALVRFDTYADFLVPKDVQADEIETLAHLTDSINNQCWILPAVYQGVLKKIFWFKSPWAHQFQDGLYQLQVGKCQQTGLLKIASTIPYFTSNCVYSPSDKLSNLHTVDIYVSTCGLAKDFTSIAEKSHTSIYDNDSGSESLDSDNRKKLKLSTDESNHKDSSSTTKRIYSLDATLINELLENKQFLLDIDLSFFSTDDPIRKQFDENEYEILRYVYTRIVQEQTDNEILQYISNRESILEQIRIAMNDYLVDPKSDQTIHTDSIYLSALIAIIRHKKFDWKSIHEYGMHLSDTRPPLHVSSEGMILYLIESMAKILEAIKKTPFLITLSKCVTDGYCSLEQSDFIQLNLEKKLGKLYKIDEILGKSLSKSLVNYDDNEDEEDTSDKNSSTIHNDEKNHSTNVTKIIETNKSSTSKSDAIINASLNNQISPSSAKSNLSPGEIKPVSPSSLSEASPMSN
jgi:hypothetical protein